MSTVCKQKSGNADKDAPALSKPVLFLGGFVFVKYGLHCGKKTGYVGKLAGNNDFSGVQLRQIETITAKPFALANASHPQVRSISGRQPKKAVSR